MQPKVRHLTNPQGLRSGVQNMQSLQSYAKRPQLSQAQAQTLSIRTLPKMGDLLSWGVQNMRRKGRGPKPPALRLMIPVGSVEVRNGLEQGLHHTRHRGRRLRPLCWGGGVCWRRKPPKRGPQKIALPQTWQRKNMLNTGQGLRLLVWR